MRPDGPIRVLLIAESPVLARGLAGELNRSATISAIVSSTDMQQVRKCLLQHHPEVIILDLHLRATDPLRLLDRLQLHYPVPVLVVAQPADGGATQAVEAVRRGALEVVPKPTGTSAEALGAYAEELAGKIVMAAAHARPAAPPSALAGPLFSFRQAGLVPQHWLVAIGASTGGTKALETLLERIPGDFPPVVIVQHMPAGFTASFAMRLNANSAAAVSEARDGEMLGPGRVVIARGDTHLIVRAMGAGWCVRYTDQRPVNRHCPSVDVLFESVAAVVGTQAVGVLLTGMGEDGARGLLKIRQAGGLTIAQNKESCVVYGMPKVAVELGAVDLIGAPEEIPTLLTRALAERRHRRAVSRT